MRQIPCPLCSSSRNKVIARLAGYWNWRMPTVICRECGFIYRNRVMDDAEMASFYRLISQFYARTGNHDRLSDKEREEQLRTAKPRIEKLCRYLQPASKVLDVGAGSGTVLELGAAHGFEMHGVELDEEAVQAGLRRGLSIEYTALEFCNFAPGAFDAITMYDVLEHVADFDRFLKKCRELLSADGLLFIEVPDTLRMYFKPSYVLLPEHNWHFSEQSMRQALILAGWEIVDLQRLPRVPEWHSGILDVVARKTSGILAPPAPNPTEYARVISYLQEVRRECRQSRGEKIRDFCTVSLGPGAGMWVFDRMLRAYARIRRA